MNILGKPISGNFEKVLCYSSSRFYYNTEQELENWKKEVIVQNRYMDIRRQADKFFRFTLGLVKLEVMRHSYVLRGVPLKGFYVLLWFNNYCLLHETELDVDGVVRAIKKGSWRIVTRFVKWIRLKKVRNN